MSTDIDINKLLLWMAGLCSFLLVSIQCAGFSGYAVSVAEDHPVLAHAGKAELHAIAYIHLPRKLNVLKDTTLGDTTYILGWSGNDIPVRHDPFIFRKVVRGKVYDLLFDLGQDLDIKDVSIVQLTGEACFILTTRYHIHIWPLSSRAQLITLEPGKEMDYRGDAISGSICTFLPWQEGKYLFGSAVDYGVFCFDLRKLSEPVELPRASSAFTEGGQPYFFLSVDNKGKATGLMARNDTSALSAGMTGCYHALQMPQILFKDRSIQLPVTSFIDPMLGQANYVKLQSLHDRSGEGLYVVDLEGGRFLEGADARQYIRENKQQVKIQKDL